MANPQSPCGGVGRVMRGGSWDSDPVNCRSARLVCLCRVAVPTKSVSV